MKNIFAILTLVFVMNFTNAQSFKFGVKGGLNYSDPSIINAKASAEISYHAGAFCEFKLSKFGIQPELLYSNLAATFDGNVIDSNAKVSYIVMPILAKFYVIKPLSIDLGPQFSYKIDESTSTSYSGFNLGNFLKTNDFDFALTGGLSFNILEHFVISGRGIYGITKVTKPTGYSVIDSFEVKNRVVQLSVGYKF